jgi:hypothetical protein
MRPLAILLVVAAIMANSESHARAASADGHFVVVGFGAVSCGGWTRERRSRSFAAMAYSGWVEGYLTSFNQWDYKDEANVMAGTDVAGVDAAIDNYCAAHPLDPISDAAASVLNDLVGKHERQAIKSAIDAALAGASAQQKHHASGK